MVYLVCPWFLAQYFRKLEWLFLYTHFYSCRPSTRVLHQMHPLHRCGPLFLFPVTCQPFQYRLNPNLGMEYYTPPSCTYSGVGVFVFILSLNSKLSLQVVSYSFLHMRTVFWVSPAKNQNMQFARGHKQERNLAHLRATFRINGYSEEIIIRNLWIWPRSALPSDKEPPITDPPKLLQPYMPRACLVNSEGMQKDWDF